MDDEEIC
jgi:hypothetical protein